MVKPKFLHDQFGISLQTLHNWKRSESDKFLLYQYLLSRDEVEITDALNPIKKLHKYKVLTVKEFAELVKEKWDLIEEFSHYTPIDLVATKNDENPSAVKVFLLAVHKNGAKKTLAVRFDMTLNDENKIEADLAVTKSIFSDEGFEMPDVYYVSYTNKEPLLPKNTEGKVAVIQYMDLASRFTNDKIIIT